jgi:flagellar protein FliS
MLYEAAIQNIKKAQACIDKGDIAGKGQAITKTHDIVNELATTLNFEVGGDVARDLERLYNFMAGQLVKANMESSKEALESVRKMLQTLLDGWRIAVTQAQTQGKG